MCAQTSRSLTSFRSDERGATAVLVAPMLAVIAGMAALSLDAVHAYTTHEKLRTTAEAAATAGVHALYEPGEARRVAVLFAEKNRPEGATGPIIENADIELGHWDKGTKTFTADPADPDAQPLNAVRATASLTTAKGNPLRTWFGAFVGKSSIDLSVSATALLQAGTICLVALDKTGSKAISLDSNADIETPQCQLHSASSAQDALYAKSNAQVKASKVCVEGGYQALGNATVQPTPQTLCDAVDDPFADVPPPDVGACNHNNKVIDNRTETLQPGVYCGGLMIKGNSNITFAPGDYVIKNGLFTADSNSKLSGQEVGFFLTGNNGLLHFNSNTELNFTAPRTGPLRGFIFYQDRNFGGTHHVDSNVTAKLDGAIYLPKATLDSNSNARWGTDSSCLMVVTHRVHFDSNSGIHMNADYSKCPWMQDNMKRSRIVA
jgi:Flp pilus assembly protein TadG